MDAVDKNQHAVFAHAPFDHLDAADIIIRSSDGVHFRMIKVLLSLVSTIFKDMFDLPRSENNSVDETRNGLPIVDLTESSGTIKNLLSFCYPAIYAAKVRLETLSEVGALLEVAMKYEMGGICKDVIESLIKPPFLQEEPLRVYAIASRHKLKEQATLAAKYTLRRPILQDTYFPELASISGRELYHVLRYRKDCAEAAMKVATEHSWITQDGYAFFNCGCADDEIAGYTQIRSASSRRYKRGYSLKVGVHRWWFEYMESARLALQSSSHGETVKKLTTLDHTFAMAQTCSACGPNVVADLRRFINKFREEIEQRISEVCIIPIRQQGLLTKNLSAGSASVRLLG